MLKGQQQCAGTGTGTAEEAEGRGAEEALKTEREVGAPEVCAPAERNGAAGHVWERLLEAVRARVRPEQYETWFRRSALAHIDDERVEIAVQNGFSRDWMQTYYRTVLEEAVCATLGSRRRVEIAVDPELLATLAPADAGSDASSRPGGRRGARRGRAGALSGLSDLARDGLVPGSDIGLNPKYTFENFVVGPCNRFAHAAALGTAEAPGAVYNPLFLHGSVGLGKTHLLQSTCSSILASWNDARILFLSCETFVNHFISALENGDLHKFRNKYRNVDVLVVDDIHILANKERTQEEFFHTFNTLYNAGKQIVLSCDSPPKDIPTLQERLVSRFKWGLVTELEPPCYETRMAILKRKSRERGHELPDDVARLLAERIDTNIRELEGAVTKLLGYAGMSGAAVTPELAREALQEVFTVRRGAASMEEIMSLVTGHFGVKATDLQSKKRTNAIAFPRQVAMFLARKITRHSLEEIGGFFGGRDHSTVLYAVDKIGKLVGSDGQSRELVSCFLQELQPPPG